MSRFQDVFLLDLRIGYLDQNVFVGGHDLCVLLCDLLLSVLLRVLVLELVLNSYYVVINFGLVKYC